MKGEISLGLSDFEPHSRRPRSLPAGSDVATVMTGIHQLIADDQDHASVINGRGFSKLHTSRGRYLARLAWLDLDEIRECADLVRHYHRQMSPHQLQAAGRIIECLGEG